MQTLRSMLSLVLVALLLGMGASGCSRQESEWRRVRSQDTVAGYEDYLQRHPLGSHAEEARQRLRALREEREWERALRLDAPEAFQQYLGAYPDGRFAEEARERLADFLLAQAPSTVPDEAGPPPLSSPSPPARQVSAPVDANPVTRTAPAARATAAKKPAPQRVAKPAPQPGPKTTQQPASKQAPALASRRELPARESKPASRPQPKLAPVPAPRGVSQRPVAGPPPAGTAAPRQAAAASDGWRVQLGAFAAGEPAARGAWQRMRLAHPADLAGLEPEIDTLTRDGRLLWRLRAGPVAAERARAICRSLRERGAACSIVAP